MCAVGCYQNYSYFKISVYTIFQLRFLDSESKHIIKTTHPTWKFCTMYWDYFNKSIRFCKTHWSLSLSHTIARQPGMSNKTKDEEN